MTDRVSGGQGDDPLDDIDFEEFQLKEPSSYDDPTAYESAYEPQQSSLISCPSCGSAQPATNRHCEQCGARLGQGAISVAPRPLATVSAGTRALTVILAVLALVVLLALIYNFVFGGDDTVDTPVADDSSASTESTPDTPVRGPLDRIIPIDISCSSELNATNLKCENLIDGTDAYWNDNSLRGDGARIIVTFATPVQLEQVQFINIAEEESFRRNYRVRGVEIVADDLPGLPFRDEIPNDNDRPHAVTTPTLGTTQVIIRITSTWPSEPINGQAFDELALDELGFWGREVESPIPESDNTTTTGG